MIILFNKRIYKKGKQKMLAIIAAIDSNNGIGKDNKLLVHIKEDLQRFKQLTENNIIIMGYNTWESLPNKPLPNRINYVLTKVIF